MTEREWPKAWRGVVQSQFQLQSTGLLASSPYTGEQTPYGPLAQRFVANVTFPSVKGPTWREWSGFITSLRGQQNKIRMVDYYRMRPGYDVEVKAHKNAGTSRWSDGSTWSDGSFWESGFLPPYCAVDGPETREATSLVMRGLPANLARVLRLGDLFEIRPNSNKAPHGMLHEVVYEARTNAGGKTRVDFEPGLRIGIVAGDTIVLRYPTSVFRLASATEGTINRTLGDFGNMGMSLAEVLPEG